MKKYVRGFKEVSKSDITLVGGKGANLGELTKLGLLVPEGFCITAEAYSDYIMDVKDEILNIANSIKMEDQSDLQKKVQDIRRTILSIELSKKISLDITEAFMKFVAKNEKSVAVRSSATAEDLPDASFAGQHETYLNVVGIDDLLNKVKECWASLWTPRAIQYRKKHGFRHSKVSMCVVVQRMISPSVSGVMFTYNSLEEKDDEIVVESTFGLGEGLVSGLVTPDTYTIEKDGLKIKRRRISKKEVMVVPSKEGVTKAYVPKEKQEVPTLSDEKIKKLAKIGLVIEQHFKSPQDIEWGLSQDRFYILQSRPVTGLGKKVPALSQEELSGLKGEWTKSPLDERVQEPLTPFTWSIAEESIPSFFDALSAFGFRVPEDADLARLFFGRPYVNKTELEKIFSNLPGVVDDFIMGGQVQIDRKKIKLSMLPVFFRAFLLVNQVHKNWDSELPEIQKKFDDLKTFQIEEASTDELLTQLDYIVGIAQSVGTTHALSIVFCEALYQVLAILVERYSQEDFHTLCPNLVSGLENKTLETNKKLWELAMTAKEIPIIQKEILKENYAHLVKSLSTTKEGKAFLNRFHGFLDSYGHRSPKYDLYYPSWGDDPNLVLEILRTYLIGEKHMDPKSMEKKSVKEREKAEELVLARLNTHLLDNLFPVKRFAFLRLLKLAQKYMTLRENQQFYIGQGYPIARRIVLQIGSHLVEVGIIHKKEDVFFLTIEEIRSISLGKKIEGLAITINTRKSEFESFSRINPPHLITREGAKEMTGKEILKGIGGSPGRASGNVKIISNITEFGRFKEGEILVAPTTNPSWTPLFLMAAGIVTEVGGMLCHGAVVAREYGIPAVLGVKNVTQILKDGQHVTLDGTKGIIYTKD
ncbi:MAG: hypothetical protein JSW00_02735 [Thermoplasmata archaeon]|nr:MAG: hypothetical protein JSW00_02735 [Thermoplasmata archaeon]